jgi:hypothetical protein
MKTRSRVMILCLSCNLFLYKSETTAVIILLTAKCCRDCGTCSSSSRGHLCVCIRPLRKVAYGPIVFTNKTLFYTLY